MYAALVKLTIDPAQAPAAAAAFTTQILPKVTSAEGFRTGHWEDPSDGEGLGLIIFETEQQARRLEEPAFDVVSTRSDNPQRRYSASCSFYSVIAHCLA